MSKHSDYEAGVKHSCFSVHIFFSVDKFSPTLLCIKASPFEAILFVLFGLSGQK